MLLKVPGYRVTELLASGSGSQVYRGLRAADDLPVVLKVLSPAYPPPEKIAWFKREYEVMRSLDVPCAVKAIGLETFAYRWAIIMEDPGGESLNRALRRHACATTELIDVAIRLASATGQLHRKGVIHKNISPANVVWVRPTGEVKLIDFGAATTLSRESAPLRNPDGIEGALAYISPEQTGRMNRTIDYRADFYSLGVTLYEIFTGRLPFPTTDPMELVHCHIARQPVPPHELCPELPRPLSEIVMKLMAKTAEARYQSAHGIIADLTACLEGLRAGTAAFGFTLGRGDIVEHFHIPQKLYGREREIAELLAAFDRIGEGAPQPTSSSAPPTERSPRARAEAALVLVTGYSGIGKSMLVRELYKPITMRRGYFISGKFDQLQRSTPYSAVVSAFQSLVRQILGEREAQVGAWRERLLSAMGPNGRVITDVIPELELIVGAQPPVPPLGPVESQNRFNLAFQNAVRVFAQPSHPLVFFLDDLQWADSASLKLIELLMSDDQAQGLFLIGAYRDNEVGRTHPLSISIDAIRKKGAKIVAIHLPPLDLEHIAELIADTIGAEPASVRSLAELVVRKTGGNPLFVTELLKTVHQEGMLRFDHAERRWQWNTAQIEARGITDNIVEFMVDKLRRLPEETQQALRLAACIGNGFDLGTLAVIRESPLGEMVSPLTPALREGFVLPTSAPEVLTPGAAEASLVVLHYRFLHDRVQQAAYALIDEDQRRSVHLRIGRLMLLSIEPEERADKIFDLVGQLNLGAELMTEEQERMELAELNLSAARKAKAAMAYAAAREYVSAGVSLLVEESWQSARDLTFSLYRELAEVEYLSSNHERAEALSLLCLEHACSRIEKADIYAMMVEQHTMLGRYPKAIETGRAALSLFGIDLPEGDARAPMEAELAEVRKNLGGESLETLLRRPPMEDPEARSLMKVLVWLTSPAFFVDRPLFGFIIFTAVNLSLRHGPSAESSQIYAYYGQLLGAEEGQRAPAFEAGMVAMRLSETFNNPGDKCRAAFIFTNFVQPWSEHLRCSLPLHDAGYQAGLEAGELRFAGYILVYKLFYEIYEGKPLAQALAHLEDYLHFNQKGNNQLAVDTLLGTKLVLSNLSGATKGPLDFSIRELSEADFFALSGDNQSVMAICFYNTFKIQALYLHGQPAMALEASRRVDELMSAILQAYAVSLHDLYTSLSMAALHATASREDKRRYEERLRASVARLSGLAESCPANFTHMRALVAAELARVTGKPAEALELYDEAIASARDNGFTQHEALANELAGRLWLARGKERIAQGFLAAAHYGYRLWGARHKVEEMSSRYGDLLAEPEGGDGRVTITGTAAMAESALGALDLISVIKACQAISREIVLEKLLAKLMDIVIENAGAERGVLMLERRGALYVQTDIGGETTAERRAGLSRALPCALGDYPAVAEGVINYVARTHESVLLNDATREGAFTRDPYVGRHRIRSILCTPLVSQGQLLGMLYLENNLTAGAFTPERLEFSRLLSAQIAISIENARLYNDMEQKVSERTDELRAKNLDLESALAHLRETQSQLVRAEKMASLGQLAAGIAHEIKNPLNFVNNFAEINVGIIRELFDEMVSNPAARIADMEELLRDIELNEQKISEHGRRADGIIRNMMAHASGAPGERRPTQLNALVEEYIKLAYYGASSHDGEPKVTFERDYDEAAGEVALVPQEIGRVLVNLFNNAIYAVREKKRAAGATYTPKVHVSTRRLGDDAVEIRVQDNGPGIPAAVQGRIFEPFFTTKPTGLGTGLGLSLSYEIVVHGHRGALTVESVEGEGATFVLVIPRRSTSAQAAPIG